MKIIPSILRTSLVIVALVISSSVFAQQYFVANTNSISDIQIAGDEIVEYLQFYKQPSEVKEMLVVQDASSYFLLAKDEKQGWVYIFNLKNENGRLYINLKKDINACQCDDLSIDNYVITGGEVTGCLGANHKVIQKP